MKIPSRFLSICLAILGGASAVRGGDSKLLTTGKKVLGWSTNGAEVSIVYGTSYSYAPPKTNSGGPVKLRPELLMTPRTATNRVFQHFLPESLANVVWTNILAITNNRDLRVWVNRTHPASWPAKPPAVEWNTHGLIWGFKGLTALSPCWEGEGNAGQIPITALTRRHGYTRGHSMGADGFRNVYAGKKVWFLAEDNSLIQVKVLREAVRTLANSNRDYTILLFDQDLPSSVQPVPVLSSKELSLKYPNLGTAPWMVLQTEQGGNVNAGLPGFSVNPFKGGDSGSPNLLPMPGELLFLCGSSSSPASEEMQKDMDQLCQLQGLNPDRYQLRWFDLSGYPSYGK